MGLRRVCIFRTSTGTTRTSGSTTSTLVRDPNYNAKSDPEGWARFEASATRGNAGIAEQLRTAVRNLLRYWVSRACVARCKGNDRDGPAASAGMSLFAPRIGAFGDYCVPEQVIPSSAISADSYFSRGGRDSLHTAAFGYAGDSAGFVPASGSCRRWWTWWPRAAISFSAWGPTATASSTPKRLRAGLRRTVAERQRRGNLRHTPLAALERGRDHPLHPIQRRQVCLRHLSGVARRIAGAEVRSSS